MTTSYKIGFKGRIRHGFNEETILGNLESIFKMDKITAKQLLLTQKPVVLKRGLERHKAERIARLFQMAGLYVELVEEKNDQDNDDADAALSVPEQKLKPPLLTHIMRFLRGVLHFVASVKEIDISREQWLDSPRRVPAGRGLQWLKSALALFAGAPLQWMAMGVILSVFSGVCMLVPLIGPLLYPIPAMVLAGGLMMAAHQQLETGSVNIKTLFNGVEKNRDHLLLLGGLCLLGFVLIGLVVGILILTTLGSSYLPLMFGDTSNPKLFTGASSNMMIFTIDMLVGVILSIPLFMALWFSAPLVAIRDQYAFDAMSLSFEAFIKNLIPLVVYILVFLLVSTVSILCITGLTALITSYTGNMTVLVFSLQFVLMTLFALPLVIICWLSIYAGFRDVFSGSE